jgi:hypothetical protein
MGHGHYLVPGSSVQVTRHDQINASPGDPGEALFLGSLEVSEHPADHLGDDSNTTFFDTGRNYHADPDSGTYLAIIVQHG